MLLADYRRRLDKRCSLRSSLMRPAGRACNYRTCQFAVRAEARFGATHWGGGGVSWRRLLTRSGEKKLSQFAGSLR